MTGGQFAHGGLFPHGSLGTHIELSGCELQSGLDDLRRLNVRDHALLVFWSELKPNLFSTSSRTATRVESVTSFPSLPFVASSLRRLRFAHKKNHSQMGFLASRIEWLKGSEEKPIVAPGRPSLHPFPSTNNGPALKTVQSRSTGCRTWRKSGCPLLFTHWMD